MNNKKELMKQVKLLIVVLIVVVVIAIIVNIKKPTKYNNINNFNSISEQEYKINGITEKDLEEMKSLMDTKVYNEYKNLFEAYKNGEAIYVPENEIISEKDKISEKELNNILSESKQNGDYYYDKELGTYIYNVSLDKY